MKKPGKTDYQVSAQDFIKAWQSSNTAQEVADKLGMPKSIVHNRATNYRQAGVQLKKLQRDGRKALDVEALNELAKATLTETDGPQSRAEKSKVASNLVDDVIASLGKKK